MDTVVFEIIAQYGILGVGWILFFWFLKRESELKKQFSEKEESMAKRESELRDSNTESVKELHDKLLKMQQRYMDIVLKLNDEGKDNVESMKSLIQEYNTLATQVLNAFSNLTDKLVEKKQEPKNKTPKT